VVVRAEVTEIKAEPHCGPMGDQEIINADQTRVYVTDRSLSSIQLSLFQIGHLSNERLTRSKRSRNQGVRQSFAVSTSHFVFCLIRRSSQS
jgi:hypothetical protein